MHRVLILVTALGWILLVPLSGLAVAGEEDPGASLLKELTTLRKAGNASELVGAIERVPPAYQGTGKGVQGKLRSELGKIAKDAKLGEARAAAVHTLLKLDDAKAAWKEVSKLMPSAKLEAAGDYELAVVAAAGKLAQSRAVKALLDLTAKAKDAKLAAAAATALGGFAADKKIRVKILDELIAVGKRAKPSQSSGGKSASPDTLKRWELLQPGLVEGLNTLTGRNLQSFDDWEALYGENKKNLKALFPQED